LSRASVRLVGVQYAFLVQAPFDPPTAIVDYTLKKVLSISQVRGRCRC
jgi:hypothetical protein